MKKILSLVFVVLSFSIFAAENLRVSDIKVEGLQRIDPGLIFNNIPFEIDDLIEDIDFSKSISLIYKTGQFKDVAIEREGQVIIISVRERPIINEINFHGTESFQPEALKTGLSLMNLASGLIFDNGDIAKAERELTNQYLSQGKYTTSVRGEVVPLERNRVDINFYIEEGRLSRIKDIAIVGNKSFVKEELLDEFSLKTTNIMSWWEKDDRYSKQTLTGDLERLRSFYMNQGFMNFKINSSVVSISKDKKKIFIAVTIDEGDKFSIGKVKLKGDVPEPLALSDLEKDLSISEGDVFNRSKVNESTSKVAKSLGNFGYAFANVSSVPTIDKDKHRVDFTFFIDPGKKIYVRRINIIGNEKSKDEVIRRELRQLESSWFAQDKVDRSKTRLTRTQFFDSVDVETPAVQGVSDQVDLNIKVTERNTGKVSIGAGLSSSEGVVGTLSVSQDNFLGTGNRIATAISTGDINKVYSLSFTDPYWTEDGVSRGFSVYHKETNTKDLGTGTYDTASAGFGMNFGIPLSEYDTLSFGATIDLTELKLQADSPVGYKNYCSSVASAGSLNCDTDSLAFWAGWQTDSRDNMIFPTKGYKVSLNADVTAPVFDMQYYKISASGEQYLPVTEKITTRIKGALGYGASYGDEIFPFFKNYTVGGQSTLRGFKQSSVGEKTLDTNGQYITYGGEKMVTLSAETFFPVPGMKNTDSFRMSAFVDAGGVFEDSFSASEMRYSMGIGATWLSPFGPLNVSLATPLNDDNLDRTETFQFGMGTNF
ncbi:MAG: outer membrane protein assembly factor BamA [Methylophilales bacterium BACL14 MAG-120920-bin58]|jgi:outer membrane protein insertion porin family|nr:MAG: outer membrane protein assembly factor BamA [Methylophilales bacterium BACL14 MAG-120920-bin58]